MLMLFRKVQPGERLKMVLWDESSKEIEGSFSFDARTMCEKLVFTSPVTQVVAGYSLKDQTGLLIGYEHLNSIFVVEPGHTLSLTPSVL